MRSLLTCKSKAEYNTLCGLLIGTNRLVTRLYRDTNTFIANETPTIQRWAVHKRNPVIAAGLNKYCSLMAQRDWDILSRTSNAVEQSANKSYSYGTNLPLLAAIQMYNIFLTCSEHLANLARAHKLDLRDVGQYNARED